MRSGGGRDFRRQRTIDAFVAAFNDAQPDVDRVLSLFADDVRRLPGHGPGRRTRAPPIRPVPMNARCRPDRRLARLRGRRPQRHSVSG
ncbi:hypothetical protein [Actinoplanes rectilineatus]|uniref:hypothetical protein n=1 Tax=Actinoplanes rectilineatus TaxID=113571 RepID=UPI0005F2B8B7|nr:hypothetical protein [Actinoplanes rectilineatus]